MSSSLAGFVVPELVPERSEAWLQPLRKEALARFRAVGFPSAKDEAWKGTNVEPVVRTPWVAPPPYSVGDLPPELVPELEGPQAARLVLVDGQFAPELSSLQQLPRGLRVTSLADAITLGFLGLRTHFGQVANVETSPFVALSAALFRGGAVVEIDAGAYIEHPIVLVHVSRELANPTVSHPRTIILAGAGSQASVVELYAGQGAYWVNAVTEVVAEEAANLDHSKVQLESSLAYHVAALAVTQDRDSHLTTRSLSFGAALSRYDIHCTLQGQGAHTDMQGLFVVGGSQHVDRHTLIDHVAAHSSSRELFKGILDDRSRGVFTGKIIVRPGAQKIDAWQLNNNLLRSKQALIDSTPQLEIRADDVKCRHGSTIGQIDPGQEYYLRSRGLGLHEARSMLTYAFASEMLERIQVAPVRSLAMQLLASRLPGLEGALDDGVV